MHSSCSSFFSGMPVLTLALCDRLSWLLASVQVHIKSLHIIIKRKSPTRKFLFSKNEQPSTVQITLIQSV